MKPYLLACLPASLLHLAAYLSYLLVAWPATPLFLALLLAALLRLTCSTAYLPHLPVLSFNNTDYSTFMLPIDLPVVSNTYPPVSLYLSNYLVLVFPCLPFYCLPFYIYSIIYLNFMPSGLPACLLISLSLFLLTYFLSFLRTRLFAFSGCRWQFLEPTISTFPRSVLPHCLPSKITRVGEIRASPVLPQKPQ